MTRDETADADSEWAVTPTGNSFHNPGSGCPTLNARDLVDVMRWTLLECYEDGREPCGHCVAESYLPGPDDLFGPEDDEAAVSEAYYTHTDELADYIQSATDRIEYYGSGLAVNHIRDLARDAVDVLRGIDGPTEVETETLENATMALLLASRIEDTQMDGEPNAIMYREEAARLADITWGRPILERPITIADKDTLD